MPDQVELSSQVAKNNESDDGGEHDPHYEPIISLPLVRVSTNEEDEVEICKIRARLYRFDKVDHEWKERGTGDIKMLHHKENATVRVVMRRDKTLKLCANHFITEEMQLKPHIGSDCAFNWTTFGDFADETAKTEFLAVKFGNADNAKIWKSKFGEAIEIVKARSSLNNSSLNNSSLNDTKNTTTEEDDSDESSSLSPNESGSGDSIVLEEKSDRNGHIENKEITLKMTELNIEPTAASPKE